MDRVKLGRTGLDVSVMGVGAGGPSQMGKRSGKTEAESASILLQAFDAGVNFVDTSENYGTEPLVGLALKDLPRDQLIISTKKSSSDAKAADVAPGLEASLSRLGTDYVDVYNLHGVWPGDYRRCAEELYPELLKLKEAGKIRFIGMSEKFNDDMEHEMAPMALADDIWDVMMIGFNLLNQSARDRLLAKAIQQDIGIQVMFAVRKALSDPDHLLTVIAGLIEAGQIDPADIDDPNDPIGFIVHKNGAVSIPDAAYRFCRHEPGTHVILSGTGNPEHLKKNIASLERGPLQTEDVDRLKHMFRNVDSITGQ
ncbi:MAG: aldo/keto reductase [Gemmatimonadetes bacterium]|nr:aldo/keto reductase [Gemmatimonadota bacterium]